jgi:hypothetical protein
MQESENELQGEFLLRLQAKVREKRIKIATKNYANIWDSNPKPLDWIESDNWGESEGEGEMQNH